MAVTINKDIIEGSKETIRNLYLADRIPWVIGYSGGKDSTATVQLVWLAISELPKSKRTKAIHIINTDTLVESPVVAKWVEKSLENIRENAIEQDLPFITHRLTPKANNTFWVNLIGRGYPFPRMKYRWCTDRLKIRPVNDFVKEQITEHGEIILVIGTRKAESSRRARTMAHYEKMRVRELLSPSQSMANELVFSPLEDWTNDDVWAFLMQYKNPWNYSNMDLLTLYRGATADNECPIMHEKNLPTCGKSRFGCWVCTMVEKDKSMEAMIANDQDKAWMSKLLEFRNKFGSEDGDRERRSFRKMNGEIMGTYGVLNHGPYKKEIREDWLEELLEIQKDISENGPAEFKGLEIISFQELKEIRKIWVFDKHEFEDTLPQIYERVFGTKFDDKEWIRPEAFGEEEWRILRETCEELYPDEELLFEMMYTLVDVENNAEGLNQRKGILESIEESIHHNYYKNELDATEYYTSKLSRKRELGGKYNEKFFAKSKEENRAVNNDSDEDVDE